MKIIEFNYLNVPEEYQNLHLCLGYFDGIHLGHQKIIKTALNNSKEVAVLTFDESPAYVLGIKASNRVLTSLADKAEILEKMEVKYLFILHIDRELLSLDKKMFIWQILKIINPSKIYCGSDYRFGKDALGTPNDLKAFFDVEVFPLEKQGNEKISSRTITALINTGEIEKANNLLGRNYFFYGLVVDGEKTGHKLGFPTANITLDYDNVLPNYGVYACKVIVFDEEYKAILCYSNKPTFGYRDKDVLEIHIINFNQSIYGVTLKVELLKKIRNIIKFDSTDDLIKQIENDITQL